MPQTELTQSPNAAPGPRPIMSAYEIDQRMSQFRDLGETIKTVREDERKLKATLHEVASRTTKAERLLSLTAGVLGLRTSSFRADHELTQENQKAFGEVTQAAPVCSRTDRRQVNAASRTRRRLHRIDE